MTNQGADDDNNDDKSDDDDDDDNGSAANYDGNATRQSFSTYLDSRAVCSLPLFPSKYEQGALLSPVALLGDLACFILPWQCIFKGNDRTACGPTSL